MDIFIALIPALIFSTFLITGVLFSAGNLFLLISISRIELEISFSLSQARVLLSTFGSIFILKESKTKKRIVSCNRWNYPYHIWSISAWHFKECIIYAVSQFIFFLYNNFTYEIFF